MVVMAIIAILATAGLSAYTGYIKKARDATRIADINAINKIVLGSMGSTGVPPLTGAILTASIRENNNGVSLTDPLNGIYSCTAGSGSLCAYYYQVCDGGLGYALSARLESSSNNSLVTQHGSGPAGDPNKNWYDVGSCQIACDITLCPGASLLGYILN